MTKIPFLASPMGKGVVSDLHECCVGSARSTALKMADVVLMIGRFACKQSRCLLYSGDRRGTNWGFETPA